MQRLYWRNRETDEHFESAVENLKEVITGQATVLALGPRTGGYDDAAIPSAALGTDDIGFPHQLNMRRAPRIFQSGSLPQSKLTHYPTFQAGARATSMAGFYRAKHDIAANDLIVRLQKTRDHEVEVLEHRFSRDLVRTANGEARFVVAVTLIEPRPTFPGFIDKKLVDEFVHELRDRNVALRLDSAVKSIERSESGTIVTKLADGRHLRDVVVRRGPVPPTGSARHPLRGRCSALP